MNALAPKDDRALLRVKIKSLAEESRIIRLEEKRAGKWEELRNRLHRHRVIDVRQEARVAHLAYGLIRGRTLERIEPKRTTEPNWKRVHDLLKKYGPRGADWAHIPGAPEKKGERHDAITHRSTSWQQSAPAAPPVSSVQKIRQWLST